MLWNIKVGQNLCLSFFCLFFPCIHYSHHWQNSAWTISKAFWHFTESLPICFSMIIEMYLVWSSGERPRKFMLNTVMIQSSTRGYLLFCFSHLHIPIKKWIFTVSQWKDYFLSSWVIVYSCIYMTSV